MLSEATDLRPGTPLDVDALRSVTPGCLDIAFLGNAGSSLPTNATLEAVIDHLRREAVVGGYRAADEAEPALSGAKASIARLINADDADEISLQHSDTTAFVKIFTGMCNGGLVARSGRIVVDRLSYSSHYLGIMQAAKVFDLVIDVLPSRADGSIDPDQIAATLDRSTSMVSATMVATHCGLVNPVGVLGDECRKRGIPFVLDACQAVGQLPVDVDAIGCDALTSTGRKWLRAPRGTGFLYVRRSLAERCEPTGIDGHSANWESGSAYSLQPASGRFDEFECSFAARVGLANALVELEHLTVARVHTRLVELAGHLRMGLAAAGATLHDGSGPTSAIVTFSVPGFAASDVASRAAAENIAINASGLAGSRIDLEAKGLTGVVRASPHIYNTTDELDRLIKLVERIR